MDTRIGSVVVDCSASEFDRLVAFWQAALGYTVGVRSEDWCRLDDPRGWANLSVQVVPDPTPGKNKLHLDLYAANQGDAVDRLLGLGATVHRRPEPGDDFAELGVPGGNLFCVVDKG